MIPGAATTVMKQMLTKEAAKSHPEIAENYRGRILAEVKNSNRAAAKAEGLTDEEIMKMDSFQTSGEAMSYIAKVLKTRAAAGAAVSENQQIIERDLLIEAKEKAIQKLHAENNAIRNRHEADLENVRTEIALSQAINQIPIANVEKNAGAKLIEMQTKSLLDAYGAEVRIVNGSLKLVNRADPAIDVMDSSSGKPLTIENLLIKVAKEAKIYALPTAAPIQNPNPDPRYANGNPSATIGANAGGNNGGQHADSGEAKLRQSAYNATLEQIKKMQKGNPDIHIPTVLQQPAPQQYGMGR